MSDDMRVGKVKSASPIYPPQESLETSVKLDAGASSLEKSSSVKSAPPPVMNSPSLTPADDYEAFAVAVTDAMGISKVVYIYTVQLREQKIINRQLEGWNENIRQIEEYYRQLLATPIYQKLQDILRLGDPQSSAVSGIQGVSSAHASAQTEKVGGLLSMLDRLRAIARVPPSAEIPNTSAPADASRSLMLPITATLLAAGGLTIALEGMPLSPLDSVVEIAQSLQPLFPTLSVQNIYPVISLMMVGPLYVNSWMKAMANRERKNHIPAIQNFAKDIIKIVADPQYVNKTLIAHLPGTQNLSPLDQERLAAMSKVMVIGVALSLLYSSEVGKVQDGKFGGIEPEEFKALLLGKFQNVPKPNKKASVQENLTRTLLALGWNQLQGLSSEDRVKSVEMLLSYLSAPKDLEPMLNPFKVFNDFAANYYQRHKNDEVKG